MSIEAEYLHINISNNFRIQKQAKYNFIAFQVANSSGMQRRQQKTKLIQIQNSNKQNGQSIDSVYSLLNRQQEVIANLLNKYSDDPPASSRIEKMTNYDVSESLHESYIKPRSQTIDIDSSQVKLKLLLSKDQKSLTRQSSPTQRSINNSQLRHSSHLEQQQNIRSRNQSINLPIIKQKNRLAKSRNKKIRSRHQFMSHFLKQKNEMQNNLYKVYGYRQQTNQISLQSSKNVKISLQDKRKKTKQKKIDKRQNNQVNSSLQFPDPETQEREEPQYGSSSLNKIQSDDQSSVQQIETKHYEKQFRAMMRGQCLEEINFLYFSRNEQMKDWTDNLLSMIQKHDKQVTSLKRKSKYLQKFDDQFFSIGIFNSDEL